MQHWQASPVDGLVQLGPGRHQLLLELGWRWYCVDGFVAPGRRDEMLVEIDLHRTDHESENDIGSSSGWGRERIGSVDE